MSTEPADAGASHPMPKLLEPVRDYVVGLATFLVRGWGRFWFTPSDPTTVALVRICTGFVLSYVYLTCWGSVDDFIGPHAWVDATAIRQLRSPDALAAFASDPGIFQQSRPLHEWYLPSAYLLTSDPTLTRALYAVFLAAMLCMTVGLFSRTACVLSWIGHLSFAHRGYLLWFGMDCVLAMLTLYLLFAPTGAVWSVDNLMRRARHARHALSTGAVLPPDETPAPSVSANVTLRLIQVNMCLIYFCAGASKLQGSTWWNGQAVWYTLMIPEFRLVDMSWLARVESLPWLPELVSSASVAVTIAFELGFPFLVYVGILRPFVLFMGLMLHAGIGLFMGLGSFGVTMLTGLGSFVSPRSLRWLAATLFTGPAGYRFVFDRRDAAQIELASFLHAADPWQQIQIVEAANGAPARPGSLVAPDGAVLTGAAAFGRAVRILRTLWLFWPVLVPKFALGARTSRPAPSSG